jgi:hypothetical protein
MHRDQHSFPEPVVGHWLESGLNHVWRVPRPVGCHTYGYMMLRGRFGITRTHREVSEKVLGNIRKVLETPERFQTLSKLYR